MRELKFRAWIEKDEKMVTVYKLDFFTKDNRPTVILWYLLDIGTQVGLFTGFEIMQYTGFKDKNGKDIYEGDILRSPANEFFEVFWSGNGWTLNGTPLNDEILMHLDIAGNVYENSKLLKGEK